ncbi:MAG: tRNA-dihydrouridine synthase family protein [Victivallales bacterium]|nr:tRNA-dihydrouridine synthase family protein [Victivallales bacterium]
MNIYPPDSIILAPLSGYTDLPYRHSARRHGCEYAFTEMIDAGSIAYSNEKTHIMLTRAPDEKWLGVQLVGSCPERITKAVEVINRHEFDVLDFNLGCPVKKVAKKGAGAALGSQPDKAAKLLELIVNKSRHPVTAKIRILDENDPEPTLYLARLLENAGAQAITIHGRIKKVFYSGPVFFDIIKAVRETVNIQVIANGGVMDKSSYTQLKERTGCDCVMLARGAMGNPWLFDELRRDDYTPPDALEFAAEIYEHVAEMTLQYGEELAMKVARKIILDYLKGRGYPKSLKPEVSFICTLEQFLEFTEKLKAGPADRYWTWLNASGSAERVLRKMTGA